MTQDQPQAQPGALLPCRYPGCGLIGCIYGPHEQWSRENPGVNHPSAVPTEEPVAWINKDGTYVELSTKSTVYGSHTIPLYTRPSPAPTVMGLTPHNPTALKDAQDDRRLHAPTKDQA